jgi:L-aminopeptidase/D-esterase-like protein
MPGPPPPRFARRLVALDDGDPLFLRILDRLEHALADRVAEAVAGALGEARAARDDDRHHHRRALQCSMQRP